MTDRRRGYLSKLGTGNYLAPAESGQGGIRTRETVCAVYTLSRLVTRKHAAAKCESRTAFRGHASFPRVHNNPRNPGGPRNQPRNRERAGLGVSPRASRTPTTGPAGEV